MIGESEGLRLTQADAARKCPWPSNLKPGIHVQSVHRQVVADAKVLCLEVVHEPGAEEAVTQVVMNATFYCGLSDYRLSVTIEV